MDDPCALFPDNLLFAISDLLELTSASHHSKTLSKTQWLTLHADVADLDVVAETVVVVETVAVAVGALVAEAAGTRKRSGEYPVAQCPQSR